MRWTTVTDDKYARIRNKIVNAMEYYGNHSYTNISLIYNRKYMLLAEMFNILSTTVNPVIELDNDDIIKVNNKYYSITTLQQVDETTDAMCRMMFG